MLQILGARKTHGGKYTIHTILWSYTLKERNHFKETLILTRYCYKEMLSQATRMGRCVKCFRI